MITLEPPERAEVLRYLGGAKAQPDERLTALLDSCESELLRPNGQILSYPVISSGPFAHEGSFRNLLGDLYDAEKDNHSQEFFVNEDTPPTFIWHTLTDEAVPVENSFKMVAALHEKKIRTEFHLFPEGTHGLSLATALTSGHDYQIMPHVAKWFDLAIDFVRET